MEEKKHIDELFRRNLEEFRPSPPADMWDRIEAGLAPEKKRTPWLYYIRAAASIAVLLGLSAVLWLLFMQKENSETSSTIADVTAPKEVVSQSDLEWDESTMVANTQPDEIGATPRVAVITQGGASSILFAENKEAVLQSTADIILVSDDLKPLTSLQPKQLKDRFQHEIRTREGFVKDEYLQLALVTGEAENDKTKSSRIRLEAGASFQPAFTYRYHEKAMPGNMPPGYDGLEHGIYRLSGGVSLAARIGERFSVESGLRYLRQGQQLNDILVFSSPYLQTTPGTYALDEEYTNKYLISTSLGTIETNNSSLYFSDTRNSRVLASDENHLPGVPRSFQTLDANLIQNLDYFQIPLQVRYLLLKGDFELDVLTGVSVLLLDRNQVLLKLEESEHLLGKTHGVKNVNYGASFGLGFAYRLNEALYLSMEPRIGFFLNPVSSDKALGHKTYPYTLSLGTGLKYRF